jgi:hypothetical protein
MAMRRTSSPSNQAPDSALARLLEVESRLEGMLERARIEAESILAAAGERAEARAGTLVAELAAADAELSATLAAEAEARIAQERTLLAAVRARYEAVDAAQARILSAWVVDEVLRMAAERSA